MTNLQIAPPLLEKRLDSCPTCSNDLAFLKETRRPLYEGLKTRIKLADLFSGAGGLTLGIAEACRRANVGLSARLALDNDPDALAVYKSNFPESHIVCQDIETVFDGLPGEPLTTVESRVVRRIGRLDLLVGGPPCQGHSDLNNRTRRKDPRNGLYRRMARAAEILKPKAVLVENVPTVIHDSDDVVNTAAFHLRNAGFLVAEALLDLSNVGVPQIRRRHVLLGLRSNLGNPGLILSSLRPLCTVHLQRTVRWAIEDLQCKDCMTPFDTPSNPTSTNQERIDWLFNNNAYDLPNELRPDCHHSPHSYRSMYGRLHWDKPAQTITTGFGSMGQGRYVHPGRRRTITPHEAARLQTFPDFFDFSVVSGRGSWARMIGNAVPPFLGITVGANLLPYILPIIQNRRSRHPNSDHR